jgi:hypothetical protein
MSMRRLKLPCGLTIAFLDVIAVRVLSNDGWATFKTNPMAQPRVVIDFWKRGPTTSVVTNVITNFPTMAEAEAFSLSLRYPSPNHEVVHSATDPETAEPPLTWRQRPPLF